jgi:hypothetical protein
MTCFTKNFGSPKYSHAKLYSSAGGQNPIVPVNTLVGPSRCATSAGGMSSSVTFTSSIKLGNSVTMGASIKNKVPLVPAKINRSKLMVQKYSSN